MQAATEELAARNDDLAAAEALVVAKEKEVRLRAPELWKGLERCRLRSLWPSCLRDWMVR